MIRQLHLLETMREDFKNRWSLSFSQSAELDNLLELAKAFGRCDALSHIVVGEDLIEPEDIKPNERNPEHGC